MAVKTKPKLTPIILDRSRLETYATCPFQGYLSILWDCLKAIDEGMQLFPWEQVILDAADPALIAEMRKHIKQSTDGRLAECGTQIHDLIDKAFEECKNDIHQVPQWFVDNLPSIKPNIQPMALRHARHVGDMIAEYHIALIGLELQISHDIVDETKDSPKITVTTRIDLLGSGKENLHVVDWKTGFKRRTNTEALDSFQAGFIAFILFKQKEYAEINTIHFWYYETMFGTKAYARFDRNEEHPTLPGLSTELALQGRVIEAVKLFLGDCREPWPLPDACAWCDVIRFCPYASMEAKEIADDPTAFVDSLVVLEALVKKHKAIATQWVKGHGVIPLTAGKKGWGKKEPEQKFTGGWVDLDKPKGPAKTGVKKLDSHFEKKEPKP